MAMMMAVKCLGYLVTPMRRPARCSEMVQVDISDQPCVHGRSFRPRNKKLEQRSKWRRPNP